MKKFTLLLSLLMSFGAFADSVSVDINVETVREIVRKAVSIEMRENMGLISNDLKPYAIDSIIIGKDILNPDEGISVIATIYPEEDNCRCQDAFSAKMYAELEDGKLTIPNGSIVTTIEDHQ